MSLARTVGALAFGILIGFVTCWYLKPTRLVVENHVQFPESVRFKVAIGEPAPVASTSPAEARSKLRPGERLLVNIIRHRVAERLEKNGFSLIGGNPTPLSKERIDELLNQIDDEQILRGAHEKGKLGDGTILERLGALFDWLVAHQDQILAIVKFVMTLLALFADEGDFGTAEPFTLHGLDQAPRLVPACVAGFDPPSCAV